jgi:hypothetical protein
VTADGSGSKASVPNGWLEMNTREIQRMVNDDGKVVATFEYLEGVLEQHRGEHRDRGRSTHSIKGTLLTASRLWELSDKPSRVQRQRRDTPGNEKWSGRWESNPHGRRFRAEKTRGLGLLRMSGVISV